MKIDLSPNDILMLLLTMICAILMLIGLNTVLKMRGWKARRRRMIVFITGSAIIVWMLILAVLSAKGFFADFSLLPPRPALAMLLPLPFVLLFTVSKRGTRVLQSVPGHWLVFMQSFRIFVEILLWLTFLAGKLPVQMTFDGRNFDVISGILALPAGYLLSRRRNYSSAVGIIYNSVGLLLLLNILIIAVLSMPTSMRYFMNEPSNVLVAQFPYIWLPGVLVPLAYSLHIFSLRQLLIRKQRQLVAGQFAV
jgi:hypothetical protein